MKRKNHTDNKSQDLRGLGLELSSQLSASIKDGIAATASIAGDVYAAALNWDNNAQFSRWLTDQFGSKMSTIASKAMDADFNETYIGGNWHRLVDGTHTISGSWSTVRDALPDLDRFEIISVWLNEYWKDLITARGMPIILIDSENLVHVSEYMKRLDSLNVAELLAAPIAGVSIYTNWNDPKQLAASATSLQASGLIYANIVAPLVSLIALGRALYLINQSEQDSIQELIAPALKGLSRSGMNILLISVLPGGILIHLSSGIVISLAHDFIWDNASNNSDVIALAIKERLKTFCTDGSLTVAITIPVSDR